MKRLTYAPKAYVFLRRNPRRAGDVARVFDVSDYVVSGNVTRATNQMSTASITLKNPDFIFSPRGDEPMFRPMDGITIWLQRIAGKPIQVFTGYLDDVPYYQMFPGNCRINASCTLKRLQHVYFDPGVPATMEWFAKYGWVEDPSSGAVLNPNNLFGATTNAVKNPTNDAGFGQLLFHFMNEIAGWDKSAIMVSDLPKDLGKQAAKLWNSAQIGEKRAEQDLANFLSKLMTIKTVHTSDTQQSSTATLVKTIADEAKSTTIDPSVLVLASLVLTNIDPSFSDEDPQSPEFGVGLFDIPGVAVGTGDQTRYLYDGKSADDMTDPIVATQAFIKRLRSNFGGQDQGRQFSVRYPQIDSDAEVLGAWFARSVGKTKFQQAIVAATRANIEQAKSLVSAYLHQTTATTTPNVSDLAFSNYINKVMPANLSWNSNGLLTTLETAVVQRQSSVTRNDVFPYYLWVAHQYDLTMVDTLTTISTAERLVVVGSDSAAGTLGFATWAGKQSTSRVTLLTNNKVYEWIDGKSVDGRDYSDYTNKGYVANAVYVEAKSGSSRPTWVGFTSQDQTGGSATSSTTHTTPSFQDLVKIDMTAAFASQFALPVNFMESVLLTGDKSIMNDIPVMQGITELCTASLREYMSLPSGEFCAFYPDYFGANGRRPYYTITDLEITNMGIQLSDKPLVTHAFVTGSTFAPGAVDQTFNEFLTAGVVTLEKVFAADNFIAGSNKDGTLTDAFNFLRTYGARPLKKPMPMIRSHFFEFLYAWQLFMFQWAAQFQTRAEFTFQPEIMAGGRLAFDGHDLEMYVQAVQHDWDYSSGFHTSATLLAPATTNSKRYPGFALASGPSGFGAIGTG